MYKTSSILEEFSLPIMLNKQVSQLDSRLIEDLECLETKDDTTKPMYHYVF